MNFVWRYSACREEFVMKTHHQQQQCDSMQDNIGIAMSSAQLRKINKPIVEKKRRERINVCLDELKDLLLQSASKQESSQSKLEKADILEMTVRHLRNTQRHQRQLSQRTSGCGGGGADANGSSSYREGYSDCAREVATYLGRLDSVSILARTRLLGHLSSRLRAVNHAHRRPEAPPTGQQLPVPVWPTSSTDIRESASASVCSSDFVPHSSDGAIATSSWTNQNRPSTSSCRSASPLDEKYHVTTTTPTPYDVNGNVHDVTVCDVSADSHRMSPLHDVVDDDSSLVWRPW